MRSTVCSDNIHGDDGLSQQAQSLGRRNALPLDDWGRDKFLFVIFECELIWGQGIRGQSNLCELGLGGSFLIRILAGSAMGDAFLIFPKFSMLVCGSVRARKESQDPFPQKKKSLKTTAILLEAKKWAL